MTETLIQWELAGNWESLTAADWPIWPLDAQESGYLFFFPGQWGKKNLWDSDYSEKRTPRPLHEVLPGPYPVCLWFSWELWPPGEIAPSTQLLRETAFISDHTLTPLKGDPFPDRLSPVWDAVLMPLSSIP